MIYVDTDSKYVNLDKELSEILMKIGELNAQLIVVRDYLKDNDVETAIGILDSLIVEDK